MKKAKRKEARRLRSPTVKIDGKQIDVTSVDEASQPTRVKRLKTQEEFEAERLKHYPGWPYYLQGNILMCGERPVCSMLDIEAMRERKRYKDKQLKELTNGIQ